MSPFALTAIIGFFGAGLFYVLSFFARNTGGYQAPLDPFGPDSLFERELSQDEASYNRNPKRAMRALAIKFLILAVIGLALDLLLG